jgi:uncharacterized membrane protein YhaH (DUF805 family)
MLSFYLKTRGRISRKAFWLAVVIPYALILFIFGMIDELAWPEARIEVLGQLYTPLGTSAFAICLWPSFATAIRRFHDLNMTGSWVLASIPLLVWWPDFSNLLARPAVELGMIAAWTIATGIALLLALAQLFVPGTRGENRFGANPLSE